MVDLKGIATRMVIARGFLMSQIGRHVTQTELAERMTRAHGKRRFVGAQVSEYESAAVKSYPLDVILASAKATGTDPGWMAFGAASAAPAPAGAQLQTAAHLPLEPLEPVSQKKPIAKRKRG